jgi:hypothetical protein
LVFLIILIVAATGLVAWLLARVGLGDFRLPRLRESSLEGASPAGAPVPTVGGGATSHAGSESDARERQDDHAGRHDQNRGEGRVPQDESDVEQAVRDRLYGRYSRRD